MTAEQVLTGWFFYYDSWKEEPYIRVKSKEVCRLLGIDGGDGRLTDFIGAVWANVSWGRYWGWDPKEVWALITMLIYASALHPASLPAFRRPMFFHIFAIAAFFSVLITYFGVNFFLGGIHAYAR